MSLLTVKKYPFNEPTASTKVPSRLWPTWMRVLVLSALSPLAFASLPTDSTVVGDTITHPGTGESMEVLEVLDLGLPIAMVVAKDSTGTEFIVLGGLTAGDLPLTITLPGDTDANGQPIPGDEFQITGLEINSVTGLVERYYIDGDPTDPSNLGDPLNLVMLPDDIQWVTPGAAGGGGGPITVPIPAGNDGVLAIKMQGARGGNGNDGGGIRVCFFKCFTIGYSPTNGKDGEAGPTIDEDVPNNEITSVSDDLSGITVSSIGGRGGKGGDGYGVNIKGTRGGSGGRGGHVSLTSEADITTSGSGAHGIFAQSRSGRAGDGGSGFIWSSGGDGGTAGQGGTVTVTNHGDIATLGDGSIGILAQSFGGAAGDGGDSWGVVGQGGSSLVGGEGGTVTVNHHGSIQTEGLAAYGILAQSIGGTGGNGGDAGGAVSFGGGGSAGGDGGDVTINLGADASVYTLGEQAHGVFAQSIGGGGGSGGTGGGVAGFGGTGAAGGSAGDVRVNNAAGSTITTEGDDADAVVAQSIGGGGGDGGSGAGIVALGAGGSAAGTGGLVEVVSGADLSVWGDGSRGIFAQSIGGGGGSARGSAGLVSLGGDGGSGGDGGTVSVTNAGQVHTRGEAGDGIVAQSVGGGGGAGGGGNGIAGIGGKGDSGGAGGNVTLNNSGQVITEGDRARGIFAQSVGGGGGYGGSGSGLVGIGGAGSATSDGGNVVVGNTGAIRTRGASAHGIQAQSIGGGGGDGGSSSGILLTLGGTGGGGGDAGDVTVTNANDVLTEGDGARGIFAQSVGGGGGNGGASYSGSAFGGIAIGGNGGSGGDGGSAAVNFADLTRLIGGVPTLMAPLIRTEGNNAEGILSQSIGGGGGNGGQAIQITGGAFGAVSAAIGGSGGSGGQGGVASLTGDAYVVTTGDNSYGTVVQSVGGGGGSGGGAISIAAAAGPAAGSFSFGMGGSGGSGGHGGAVTVDAGGGIHTKGDLSNGFLAQSVGGGGGRGGWVVNASIAAGEAAVGIGVGLGGSGGDGGDGGEVDVDYTGDIYTEGLNASAWTIQSVGGGGGQGGFNISGVAAASSGASGAIAFGIGGSGGGGGDAGSVSGRLLGDVGTLGNLSDAVVAQSVGGGGGSGGVNVSGSIAVGKTSGALSVGFGGSGGSGGDGDQVDLVYEGSAFTGGDDANAVMAQSVGGGGGRGGMNVSGSLAASSESGGAVAFGMGGSGGGGGDAGSVTSEVSGTIVTQGAGSSGVITQSVGGGGGSGGINVSGAVALSGKNGGSLSVGIGGSGGDGGNSGNVTSTIEASVNTLGDYATGILTQSTGGGGGNGALNVSGSLSLSSEGGGSAAIGLGGFGGGGGDAGDVYLNLTGSTSTAGSHADAVVVQSTGGGGGSGGINLSGNVSWASTGTSGALGIGLGGFGGSGGNAGSVGLDLQGDTTTQGSHSNAVTVQSVGGGGGSGGINITGNLSRTSNGGSAALGFGLGGFGGSGGSAGDAALNLAGNTITRDARSNAVTVQSIGGGGGQGAINVTGSVNLAGTGTTGANASLGVGGFGGGGGDAGHVSATIVGDVLALGSEAVRFEYDDGELIRRALGGGSHGVMAQSIGGSGGDGSFNISGGFQRGSGTAGGLTLGVGGFGGDGGDAGRVDLNVTGAVAATGDYRGAVTAQSIGGGGGTGGFNIAGGVTGQGQITAGVGGSGGGGGSAEDVVARIVGDVFAHGFGASGLLVQSIGGGGGSGGTNLSFGASTGGSGSTPSLAFGIGGAGGAGNSAGSVDAVQEGAVFVQGQDSVAILIQSIGGGGGRGALNSTANRDGSRGIAASIGIGGEGGIGADAGEVLLHSDGYIRADGRLLDENDEPVVRDPESDDSGNRATGILVQSIGGGGGQGGMNISGVFAPQGSVLAAGVGGSGGDGGEAGAVTVVRGAKEASTLETFGDQSHGLVAQSIGGGGGNAGKNLVFSLNNSTPENRTYEANIVIGGAGGDSGDGNDTRVDHSGDIFTQGNQSIGLLAQSIGGGGGNAAFSFGIGLNTKASGINVAVGGAPGDGGLGGRVEVNHDGVIATKGHDSGAIIAQSIGGGGGNTAMTTAFAKSTSNKLDMGLGRQGGSGGEGGDVRVNTSGDLFTEGDRSVGIFAQSVGNGGGRSSAHSIGFKVSGTDTGTAEPTAQASAGVSLGLQGGQGGRGGEVIVDTTSRIVTRGLEAHAIHVQSTGGGGGVGGAATGMILSETAAARVALGGAGGSGGAGGLVDLRSKEQLVTYGDSAHGLYAQSIGGGGGTGGLAAVLSLQLSGASTLGDTTAGLTVGGTGGTGAEGGIVRVHNQGGIFTHGSSANGISVQSVGGGGGDGGLVLNGSLSKAGNKAALSVALGGSGGTGGEGGMVEVSNEGQVVTRSEKSIGIFAQSVGGGGGNAGLMASLGFSLLNNDATSADIKVHLGGKGGTGGVGGAVSVTNGADALIATEGAGAYGIFAQSIGGGGGNGSSVVSADFGRAGKSTDSSVSLGLFLGGDGGVGSTGGAINVNNQGIIETLGDQAHGVYAQSIGGGGGNGGIALATDVLLNASTGGVVPLAIGGSGGEGGDGGRVTVDNIGQIVTHGRNAYGILAQSIGGGGGNGNVGLGLGNSAWGTLIANGISAALGGRGAEGGTGGEVTVKHSGNITVTGEGSRAFKMESINGGGGGLVMDFNGITSFPGGQSLPSIPGIPIPGGPTIPGTNPGNWGTSTDPVWTLRAGGEDQVRMSSGALTSDTDGDFITTGERSAALNMQSVGGGGGDLLLNLDLDDFRDGDGALALRARLGGKGGSDNSGSGIVSSHRGGLYSTNHYSSTAALRSVGGGGGHGFINVSGDRRGLGEVSLMLGADGGSGSNAGDLVHHQNGDVVSVGDGSVGFLAQSIGAGGGELQLGGVDAFGVGLGGENNASGDGGAIDLSFTGALQTSGRRSHAAFLQSIGGGGGAVFTQSAASPAVQLSAANRGDGGDIRAAFERDIIASGMGAYGLFVQSLGGGGGYVDGAGAFVAGGEGRGGAIDIDLKGSVFAADVPAVFLQSRGSTGAGNISLSLAAGQYIASGSDAAALIFDGGNTNHFSNRGMVFTTDDVHGTAMVAQGGDNHVDNFGTIVGNLKLGDGRNQLITHAGGRLIGASVVDLGHASAMFRNSGILAPGGSGLTMRSHLNGSYQQDGQGLTIFELDLAGDSTDSLFATGHMDLDGAVDIQLLNRERVKSGAHTHTVFRAEQGIEDKGYQWNTSPSAVINYQLAQRSAEEIRLTYHADFTAHNQLHGNPGEIGRYLNRVQDEGSSAALGDLVRTLVDTVEVANYRRALTQLSAAPYAAQQSHTLRATQQFGRALMSCSASSMAYRYERQGSCTWLRVDRPDTHFDAQVDAPAMDYSATRTAVGGQKTTDDLTVGLALSVENFDTSGFEGSWSGSGNTTQLGAALKYQLDDVLLTSSLVTGLSDTRMRRSITLLDPVTASGTQRLSFVTGALGLSQQFHAPWFTVRPLMEVGVSRMRSSGETEDGAGNIGLELETTSENHRWYRPGLEIGREFVFNAGSSSLRPYLRASALRYFGGGDETTVQAHLIGAPAGVEGMSVSGGLGHNQRLVEAGLDFVTASGMNFVLHVERAVADEFETDQASLKIVVPF